MRSKILMAAVAIVVVVGLGIGVGLLASHGTVAPPPVPPVPVADTTPNSSPSEPDNTQPIVAQNLSQQTSPIFVPPPAVQTDTVAQATNLPASTNWEDTIDSIVGSDDADTNKVKQLFALFPKLPPDGQEEVVQHLSNLVEDENYAQLGTLMTNDSLSEGVLDELLADLLNRPNSVKLPMLLDVAQDPDNSKSSEAKDLLELYLGDDYGTNWSTWGAKVTDWMTNNPD